MEVNKIENDININNNITEEKQRNFLDSALGKTINTAVDFGIRTLLPNFLDEQIINIKDNLLNYGLKEGIGKTINDAIDLGKSTLGIVTGNFESISQVQSVIKNGGIIDGISTLFDTVVNNVYGAGLINKNIAMTLKQGKNTILNNVESNIEKSFTNQIKSADNLNRYISNWKESFEKKDFSLMEKEYNKIEKEIKNLIPMENTINEARTIENLHNLIKNNGQNFNLTKEEIELSQKLK